MSAVCRLFGGIYVDPNGNLLGDLSAPVAYEAEAAFPIMWMQISAGTPSPDYTLRVYRSPKGDFSIADIGWLSFADYSCDSGTGGIASYCNAGSTTSPLLRNYEFSW